MASAWTSGAQMGSTKWDHRLKSLCQSIIGDLGEDEIYELYGSADELGFKDLLCKTQTDSCKHSQETTVEIIAQMEAQAKVDLEAQTEKKADTTGSEKKSNKKSNKKSKKGKKKSKKGKQKKKRNRGTPEL